MSTITAEPARSFAELARDEPIRGELLGPERLEAHARELAQACQSIRRRSPGNLLLRRFRQNGRELVRAHQRIVEATRRGETITSDAEWLLDNFHIIIETLREIDRDLPRGYYRELPKIANGPFRELPRAYCLCAQVIAHTDSCLDEANLFRFVQSFQAVTPLTIGELWAIPIMLRLGLLENLRRLASEMLRTWDERHEAEALARHFIVPAEEGESPTVGDGVGGEVGRPAPSAGGAAAGDGVSGGVGRPAPSAGGARRGSPDPASARRGSLGARRGFPDPAATRSDPCVVRLLQMFRDHGPGAAPGMEWLERMLRACNCSPAEVLRREHQRQAANQVSVGNCVTSLRLLANLDWMVFFERTSQVEAILRGDPAGVYPRQDFHTKDRYRRVVEHLARGSAHDELDIARRVVTLARRHPRPSPERPATDHVGTYLVGSGRKELERDLDYRPRMRSRLREVALNHPNLVYFGGLVLLLSLLLWGFLALGGAAPGDSWPMQLLILAVALLPASELAVGILHSIITLLVPPRVLPKLDLKDGIPPDCATFVVMPAMLIRSESAAALTDRLEVHYLSNSDAQLRFALLTDFADAPQEAMPEDEQYVSNALARIKALNQRYCAGGPDRFFLLHRRRLWNPAEGCWMGWERKRGKLSEFNRLLRGAKDTSYAVVSGDLSQLPLIRFVITLDADTQLLRESARRLIGTLAHPLNRPRFDARRGCVVEGYSVLQPRVSLNMLAATRSLFARILASSAGIDPYTTAVSDVYQDLFGRGTFTGKGIYDVDAFEAAAGHTFPENHILSHDLIEGNYARCGLVTDIELLDDFPARYHAYARREHRWIRGDWQILPWLFRKVPAPANPVRPGHGLLEETREAPPGARARRLARRSNPLPALERWKVFDNLRRSLVPPALIVLFVLGWTVLPGSPWAWTGLGLLVVALPLVLLGGMSLFSLIQGGSWLLKLRGMGGNLGSTVGQVVLATIFLANQARLALDAIVRTLVRTTITHRHLLVWETAASTERRLGTSLLDSWVMMWPAPVLAALVGALVGFVHPGALLAALPLLIAWFLSPVVAYWVSRPRAAVESPLTAGDRADLRRIARKTWHFFETFVGDKDHWLPPDNFQEQPKGQVAHRTSPTNIGFALLSTLAAHDLGYLSLAALVERLEKTFATLDQLERFRGHLHNWYDTTTLQVLQPGYVSTVDSGNLLACLVTLKQGLREKADAPVWGPAVCAGLADTLGLIEEAIRGLEPPAGQADEPFRTLEAMLSELGGQLAECPSDLPGWDRWLDSLDRRVAELLVQAGALSKALAEEPEELREWVEALAYQVRDRRDELAALAPWVVVLSRKPRPGVVGQGARLNDLMAGLRTPGSVADLETQRESILADLASVPDMEDVAEAVQRSGAADLQARLQQLADRAIQLATEMDFGLLYNGQRYLFSIGYNTSLGRLDPAHYDLLASEASLTSFLAVARGDVPQRHWFQLGRQITYTAGGVALLSWGGTMFEYLMPRLFFRSYPGTLLDESRQAAVARQIEYGRQSRVPWGISESGFNALDAALDYQYQSFGVPGLGLKRGLSQDLVVAPYATALALIVRPHDAVSNLRALAGEHGYGKFGYYEAIDFTRDRMLEKRRPAVVRQFMAHHQGMSLVALTNCLLGDPMPRRFHAEPMVRATELLLQERVPQTAQVVEAHEDEASPPAAVREGLLPMSRRLTSAQTPHPRTHVLSNGQYTVVVTNAGAGFSAWRDLDVTRWREDRTGDAWGQFCYIRDLRTGLMWSAGHQPVRRPADQYEVIYSTDKAEFRRSDAGIETHLEITVSPEHAAEVRRLTLTNHNPRVHDLEVTSYAEVVLNPHRADLAHPAFGKLFLETEFLPRADALLCRRRPRSAEQKPTWALHVVTVEGPMVGGVQYETDRARFLGRGRTPADPAALEPGAVLSGATGPVLDPLFSLRRRVRVAPGASVSVTFTTAVASSREEALVLADRYHDTHGVTRAFEMAWAHSQVQLRHLHLSAEEAHLFQRLAAHVLYAGPTLRAPANVLTANHLGQAGLWRHGISGDRPIVLAKVSAEDDLNLVRQLLLAHAYWRLQGLEADLVLLSEAPTGYLEELNQQLQNLIRTSDLHGLVDKPGGIFLRKADQLALEDTVLLQAAARVVLSGSQGTLTAQVDQRVRSVALPGRALGNRQLLMGSGPAEDESDQEKVLSSLRFANGLGGFTRDGREYVIVLSRKKVEKAAKDRVPRPTASGPLPAARCPLPAAPWINVIANPACGFLVSESGGGYTWAGNSQMNRLTPWNNDPVVDPPGEVLYLRDEKSGAVWTPTPLPLGGPSIVRHGQGYTIFQQTSHGLEQELLLLVPPDDPVKLIRLKVRNTGGRPRRLSATFYAEWVLGVARDAAPMQVITELDADSGALFARNPFNAEFASAVAFADVSQRPRTFTGDRTEFLGRNGSVAAPAALERVGLAGQVGPTLDPCAALMAPFDLPPGATKEIVFLLGEAPGRTEARQLLASYREPGRVQTALEEVQRRWEQVLTAVQVKTPNPGMDLLLNRWLLYQVLSCRFWGRSALYQSGGAFGFRDQLQDVMALVHGAPAITRAHLLRAASRQFFEGDVQHWWHPPAGQGVRTRFSDDFLWLPFAACHYVAATGDTAVLDERVPFLRAPLLAPDQEEVYNLPEVTEEKASVYEHCVRALENGFHYGAHGLPLMGIGDWNDGMNRVGVHGKGESVWNAWFQITILQRFTPLVEARGDTERATRYREQVERLRRAVEEQAWDGEWYRRAYFDDGTPLGSVQNDECKIDSLAQTWGVISGVADPERVRQGMAAVERLLVRPQEKLVLLFTPPFDKGPLQPGYIKGYVPGIRENGGQYTHAAAWVVQALAKLGQGKRAVELFDLLNPIHHAATPEDVTRYKVEPYVVAGDIYGAAPNTGRGGWTWYTGSASWLYRVALETILGFRREGDRLRIEPCVAPDWKEFELTYWHGSATYHIKVTNPGGVERGVDRITVDGAVRTDGVIPLLDDGGRHEVEVVMG